MAEEKKTMYQVVMEKFDMAKAAVEDVREKLRHFDAKEQTAAGKEKASAYFSLALDKVQEAIADLTKQAQALKDNATEIPVRAFSNAFARANEALTELKERAKTFDEQHHLSSKVQDTIHNPREQATVAIASASSYVSEAAHSAYSQLQGVSDGIKLRVVSAAEQGLDKVLPVAATYDEKLHISENAAVVAQQVKQFDEKYHVSDKLIDLDQRWALSQYFASALSSLGSLDQRITGGNVQPVMASAYEMGLNMAGYVCHKYGESKAKVAPEGTCAAPHAEETKAAASQPAPQASQPPAQAAAPSEPAAKAE